MFTQHFASFKHLCRLQTVIFMESPLIEHLFEFFYLFPSHALAAVSDLSQIGFKSCQILIKPFKFPDVLLLSSVLSLSHVQMSQKFPPLRSFGAQRPPASLPSAVPVAVRRFCATQLSHFLESQS